MENFPAKSTGHRGYQEQGTGIRDLLGRRGSGGKDVNGTINDIGNGKRNTQLIVELLNQEGEIMKAAQVAEAYEYGGFDDWFLPSKGELDLIYKNLKAKSLGGFQSGSYWTSSDYGWGNSLRRILAMANRMKKTGVIHCMSAPSASFRRDGAA
ncbi:MAG: hypothetical protein LBB80_07885 [Treponema sp.]|jgi:hypothetical protein|nr:hypothetical protein [Treponema sp.]